MPAILLLPLLLATVLAPAPGRAAAPAIGAACAEAGAASEPGAGCAGKALCSAGERTKLVCDLARALEDRYVFFATKRVASAPGAARTSVDAHLAGCVADERAIAREDEPLRFYDRLRRCTAALEDGHVMLGATSRLPTVALGVALRRVEGRVVVAAREQKLAGARVADADGASLEEVLAVGNEVLELDGRPVQEALEDVARHVPASSAPARLERAVDALTRRDFLFPEARTATLTVAIAGRRASVELPWSISTDAKRHPVAGPWARRAGLATADLAAFAHERSPRLSDPATRPLAGALRSDPILPPREAAALRVHLDEQGRVAVRAGEVTRADGRSFCYLQILTFHAETLAAGGERQPFVPAVDAVVRGCKEKGLDVVLDLRRNEGGYLANATGVVSALLPRGAAAPPGALLLRVTAQNREVYAERVRRGRWPADGPEPSRASAALEAAGRSGLEFTPAFLEAPVGPSASVGGYDGRVVALVAPTCMSACDRAAAMLRGAGRAVLLGEPTEGAGASQQEVPGRISTRWADAGGHVSLAIPNAAMGVPRSADAAPPGADEFFASLALENRPVEPDLGYAPTLEDLTGHNRGWLARVEAVLFPPEGDAVASAPPPSAYRGSTAR
jgi:hypothetical protein